MAEGKSNAGIAEALFVTEAAVEKHVTAIFRKLGITDRLRLALYLNGAAPLAADGVAPRSNLRNGDFR